MKKSENSKKAILTHSSGPQGNLKQLFCCCSNSKSKVVASVDGAYASKDKMVSIWPTFNKKLFFYFSPQVLYL
jgi:hypothetical protein